MGLFGNKLLLELFARPLDNGSIDIQIKKINQSKRHILPFSTVSLIGSQLTVLSSYHPRSLCIKLLKFIEYGSTRKELTPLISNIKFEIYEGTGHTLFNQFKPIPSRTLTGQDDNQLQSDVENILMNYVSGVYERSSIADKEKLRLFLLMIVTYYQNEIVPIVRRINMYDVVQRGRLAKTHVDICSDIFHLWDEPISIKPDTPTFITLLEEAKRFDSYLS
ncbi:MAG: hypothetical protein ACYC3P_06245 [Bellilinea sp.]